MDEHEYQATYQQVNPQVCVFEKALLTQCCDCPQAVHNRIAEREAIGCRSPQAQNNCTTLLELLRQNARFVLKMTNPHAPLPHTKALKLQCGGLSGLQQLVLPEADGDSIQNVHLLVQRAQDLYGSLTQIPLPVIVQNIALFEVRPSHKK